MQTTHTPTKNLQSKRRHFKLVAMLSLTVFGMFGFAFALVPLYDKFCEYTGLLGKVDGERVRIEGVLQADTSRMVTIEFVSAVRDIPWRFYPKEKSMVVHPGEMNQAVFIVENLSNEKMIGQAIPSLVPGEVNRHFKKTQCFCFDQTILEGGDRMEMPVVFFIDEDLPKTIPRITLSYTLFEAKTS